LDRTVVDQILAEEVVSSTSSPGTALFAATDNQGSVHDWASYDDGVVDHISYGAFGNITYESAGWANFAIGHEGTFYDKRHRPRTPRPALVQSDSSTLDEPRPRTASAPTSNPYRYVGNSPTNFVDPSGAVTGRSTGGNRIRQRQTTSRTPLYPASSDHN